MVKNKMFFFGGFDEELISTKTSSTRTLDADTGRLGNTYGLLPWQHLVGGIQQDRPFRHLWRKPVSNQRCHAHRPGQKGFRRCPGVQFGGVTRVLADPDSMALTSPTVLTISWAVTV